MSEPVSYCEYKRWTADDAPEDRDLRADLQEFVHHHRMVMQFIPMLKEYINYLRYEETARLMRGGEKLEERKYTDALQRIESDLDRLEKGRMNDA